jgi:CheY-like chemotaxis protein
MARRKILIVDDTPGIRHTLHHILTSEGCDVDTAANGAVAQGMLSKQEYDLLLIDIRMPVMNGIELCQYIEQEHPEYTGKVILMSADMDADTQHFLREGKRRFLPKGFTFKELSAAAGWI